MSLGAALIAEILSAIESDPALAERLRKLLVSERPADALIDARASGLSAREFRGAVRCGELRASKVGRRYVATRADLNEYISRRRADVPTCVSASAPVRHDRGTVASRAIDRAVGAGKLRVLR